MDAPLAATDANARGIVMDSLADDDEILPGVRRTIRDLIEWQDADIERLKVEVHEIHDQCVIGDNALGDSEHRAAGLEKSLHFYTLRHDLLAKTQKRMRNPERTLVCDILANGTLLPDPQGKRYGTDGDTNG